MNSLSSAPNWAVAGIVISSFFIVLAEIAMWISLAYGSLPHWLEITWTVIHIIAILVWGFLSWRTIL